MSEDVAHAEATDSSLSPYQLLPATPDDAEAIMAFNKRAFQNDYMMSKVYPKEKSHLTSPEELFAWRVKRLRTEVEKGDMLYSKVVQKDVNKLVAQRGWAPPGYFRPGMTLSDKFGKSTIQSSSDAPSREVLEPPATTGQDNEGFPASINRAVHKDVLAIMDEERAKIWEGDANYWYLGTITVDPDYRRQGLATMLMKEGLDRADADGVPTYLEATPEGALIYPKFGFRKVKEHSFSDGRHIVEFHIRQPHGSTSHDT